jgi:TRAP-type C4-dicarboxylate transport system permease small subunit
VTTKEATVEKNKEHISGSLYDFIERIFTVYIPGGIVVIVGIFISAEILARLLFNYSFFGVVDVVEQTMVLLTFLSLAVTQIGRTHITMDMLPKKLERRRAGPILDCVLLALSILIMAFVLMTMAWYLFRAYKSGLTTVTLFMPVWPFALGMSLGVLFMILRLAKQFKKSFLQALAFKSLPEKKLSKEEVLLDDSR